MNFSVVNQVAFLRTTRNFPEDLKQLTIEVNKTYVDIANAVNVRTIGLFPTNRPALTGESWYLSGNQRRQSLRQIYQFTSTVDINIGFKLSEIDSISKNTYGSYTDSTGNWYGAIFGSNVAIAGQISFFLFVNAGSSSSDLIRFLVGAGAPTLTKGVIDLEWISKI